MNFSGTSARPAGLRLRIPCRCLRRQVHPLAHCVAAGGASRTPPGRPGGVAL